MPFLGTSQEVWGIEKCISYAIEKSLQIETSLNNLENSELDLNLAKHSRYPNLSASSNVGWNFGRTIDPTRNEFITETFFNNGFGLNTGMTLYNSNKINNRISQASTNNKASLKDVEQTKRDIALNVSSIYLNILFAKENLKNAENQFVLSNEQLIQLKKQIAVGNLPENDVMDIEAQLAMNEQSIVEAKNNLNINFLNLKQLLRLDPDYDLDIKAPELLMFETDPDVLTFNEVYESALKNQAGIHASELRLQSANLGEKIAKADYFPVLSVGGSTRTNYSNKGFSVSGFKDVTSYQDLIINNQEVQVGFKQSVPTFVETPYFDQFKSNLSYAVGFSLSIPIYNNNIVRSGVQRAKLNIKNAKLNNIQLKENLKITIGQALSDARAAKARYQASAKSSKAQENLYRNAVKRFEIGNLNTFELTRIKTQMETQSVNELISKYEYFFRTKILDFYLGKQIKL
jgi:outer membrane protein